MAQRTVTPPPDNVLAWRVPSGQNHVLVGPNQCALLCHGDRITEILLQGTHQLKKTGDLWFFSGIVFAGRKWALLPAAKSGKGEIPLRANGSYDVFIRDPRLFFQFVDKTSDEYSIDRLEEWIQARIQEIFAKGLSPLHAAATLLQDSLGSTLAPHGVGITQLQISRMLLSSGAVIADEKAKDPKARCRHCHNTTSPPDRSCSHCGRDL